ncbi:Uncharacterized protein YdiC [Neochlamydia sp. EPS4]|uniref:tRNA (adenosine(37)-N6)-threonylcarbamoyltransferase complex dimerization subunit type 1 TsaB n=1 Tax=Neochlamydia sp. EPS4 TaxID=1478175 RepID=UPI000582D728|nr:tRNA (adenosine(37)-N6)-threonylcarbamoyltransferase complex dimerization subunit type 1 TsaB [Neochlamydia sp. EPS4]KIC74134.1 Uncharacterized protein YdiC [Neochlamydia sp. EPS4]
MFSLVIDTSSERGCAAFFDGIEVIFQGNFPFGLNSSQSLLPEIERGLKCLGRKAADLSYVAVGIGPGSYTGIRVGVVVAKAVAFSLRKPLVTFCSLEGFLPSQEGSYAVLFDAKIGGVYVLKGQASQGAYQSEGKVQLLPLSEVGVYLQNVNNLLTPNSLLLKQKIENMYPNQQWTWEEKGPDALYLSRLSEDKWRRGEIMQKEPLEILYLRKTQAEIEKELQKSIQY